jgi:hypothetical protein
VNIKKLAAIALFGVASVSNGIAVPADHSAARSSSQSVLAMQAALAAQRQGTPFARRAPAARSSAGANIDFLLMCLVIGGLVAVQLRRSQDVARHFFPSP